MVALYSAVSGYHRERMLRELGFSYDTELEARKSELAREETAARARTEYEYSARLSMYQRFEPLMFQLIDLAELAVDRIKNLTYPSVWAARYRRAVKARGHFPTEQAALKCLYLVTRSLDPTGTGRTRWAMRWKPALNAFAITFGDRFPAAETY